MELLESADVDRRLRWPIGRAKHLARRGKLPHLVLPDGEIRFRWEELERLIVAVAPARHDSGTEVPDV